MLGVYYVVHDTEGDDYFVKNPKDLQWLLNDYPDATVDIFNDTNHIMYYEGKRLKDVTRGINLPKLTLVRRADEIRRYNG